MRNTRRSKVCITVAGALALLTSSAFAGQLTVFQRSDFQGRNMTVSESLPDLDRSTFNDQASSITVNDGTWEACTEAYYRGRCAQLAPGSYSKLSRDLHGVVASVRQIGYDPAPARVTVVPDAQPYTYTQPYNAQPYTYNSQRYASPPPVAINPGNAPSVISPQAQAPTVVETLPVPTGPRIVLYQHMNGRDVRAVELTSNAEDLDKRAFENSADAAFVSGGVWRLCDGEHGRGQCMDYSPGRYETLGALDGRVKSAYLIGRVPEPEMITAIPPGRAVLYELPNFSGAKAVVEYGRAPDLDWARFSHPASSLRVESGTWLMCSEMGYQGECRVLGPGEYPQLSGILNQGVASARQIWRPQYGSLTRDNDASNRYRVP